MKTASSKRRALVTGASSGIGLAFAEVLARDGHDLVVVARSAPRLEALAHRLHAAHHVTVEVVKADLTKAAALGNVEAMIAADRHLDLLVNNAGFGTIGRFVALDPDREEEEIRLNVVALVRLTRAALPGMVSRRRGAVINVSSLAAFTPGPVNATYSATKAFVNSFTEALHEELRGTGVRVQALCPGFTRTEFQERAGIDKSRIPSFAWMSAEAVVEASLAGLRRGQVVCIPGLANRLTAAVTGVVPRRIVRRAVGIGSRRVLEG
jgi:hypothetical protein